MKAEVWPASRIVACTRSLDKVQAAAAAGVVCTNKVSAAMQGCRVLVLCCRADQLVNQAIIHLRARDDVQESESECVRTDWGSMRVNVIDARETKQSGND
jgi:pyrroline-5-carboxylate reductase